LDFVNKEQELTLKVYLCTVKLEFQLGLVFVCLWSSVRVLIFFSLFKIDVGADVLDLAETMVASADGLIYEPVS